jgi:hypothetical protein
MRNLTTTILAGLCVAGLALAQDRKVLSPAAEASVDIGGKHISIKYSAPTMRGRKIFGDLVPYGQVWRTGANAATSFTTDADLSVKGLKVPKGSYTLFTLVERNEWLLIINKQTGQGGTDYDQSQDFGRVKMDVSHTPQPVEAFKITLSATGGNKGLLKLEWETTAASVPFTVE